MLQSPTAATRQSRAAVLPDSGGADAALRTALGEPRVIRDDPSRPRYRFEAGVVREEPMMRRLSWIPWTVCLLTLTACPTPPHPPGPKPPPMPMQPKKGPGGY